MSISAEAHVGFLLRLAENKSLWTLDRNDISRHVGSFMVCLSWDIGGQEEYNDEGLVDRRAYPFSAATFYHGKRVRITEIQVHRCDPITGSIEGQVARDAVLWWELHRGVIVYRDPPDLMEALAPLSPLEALAWAAK